MAGVGSITVQDAQIKTATVEIKALTVSGKQVTLAVFRQLLESPVIDYDTGELLGIPWGMVNYHWGACPSVRHIHVVWQDDDQLRRSAVPTNQVVVCDKSHEYVGWSEYAQRLANAYVAVRSLKDRPDPLPESWRTYTSFVFRWPTAHETSAVSGPVSFRIDDEALIGSVSRRWFSNPHGPSGPLDAVAKEQVRLCDWPGESALADSDPNVLLTEIEERFWSVGRKRNVLAAKLRETVQRLQQLDQLFIAV